MSIELNVSKLINKKFKLVSNDMQEKYFHGLTIHSFDGSRLDINYFNDTATYINDYIIAPFPMEFLDEIDLIDTETIIKNNEVLMFKKLDIDTGIFHFVALGKYVDFDNDKKFIYYDKYRNVEIHSDDLTTNELKSLK